MVKLTINGIEVEAGPEATVLEAARKAHVHIPTLCSYEGIHNVGSCRMCVVEIEGARTLQASCTLPVREGMKVRTNTPKVRDARKMILQFILSEHPEDCQTCSKNQLCELQRLAHELGVRDVPFERTKLEKMNHIDSPYVTRDLNYCILCGRCARVCSDVQAVHAIDYAFRGYGSEVNAPYDEDLANTKCVSCGQCVIACPTAALSEQSHVKRVWNDISSKKMPVVQFAPAVRAAIGEEFGLKPGEITTGRLVAALRRLGFKKVFDTNFAADLTIIEEGNEFIGRVKEGRLPMFTSCCPGWINYAELLHPEALPMLSTCKSPHEMLGALVKSYLAGKEGVDPADISVTSVMPCVAKKQEADRTQLGKDGRPDVDNVLTTRELALMIREAGVDFKSLDDEEADAPLGIYSGAAAIFGASGGVMEAALRTVYETLTGQELSNIDFKAVRGLSGVKEATVEIQGRKYSVAVVNGLANAEKILSDIASGSKKYDFVEVMACPGGCIGGGGQPVTNDKSDRMQKLRDRAASLYSLDERLTIRKSHKNPAILALYEEFLGEPLGHKNHELLHTRYAARKKGSDEPSTCCG
jgi:iron-only hydrogenase group A